mmetsp:Transcript_44323/g.141074  ORF Transcript_44323/g.141074 Transcript_44323/m.141074 type:complete len:225 (+) Transcript_44323:564-1238(+)
MRSGAHRDRTRSTPPSSPSRRLTLYVIRRAVTGRGRGEGREIEEATTVPTASTTSPSSSPSGRGRPRAPGARKERFRPSALPSIRSFSTSRPASRMVKPMYTRVPAPDSARMLSQKDLRVSSARMSHPPQYAHSHATTRWNGAPSPPTGSPHACAAARASPGGGYGALAATVRSHSGTTAGRSVAVAIAPSLAAAAESAPVPLPSSTRDLPRRDPSSARMSSHS